MKMTSAFLTATALAGGLLTVAVPAGATTTCTGTSQTKIITAGAQPGKVVVGTTVPRQLTLFSQIEDPCTASVSSEVLLENSPLTEDMEPIDRIGNVASFQIAYVIDPADLSNADAGRWQADITAHGTTAVHATAEFVLLRASRLQLNASPEPVRTGRTITVEGRLTRASWDTDKYHGMQKAEVTVEARRAGGAAYVPLKTVTTDAKGRLKLALTGNKDICIRLNYAGSATTAPSTSDGDCVNVR